MPNPPAQKFEERRRRIGLSLAECWTAYFALGGQASSDQLTEFLAGRVEWAEDEIDILAAALDERDRWGTDASTGSPTQVVLADDLGAPVDSLVAWLEPGVGVTNSSPLNPFLLSDVHLAVRSSPAFTQVEPLAGSSPSLRLPPGSVLRVDAADQERWEVHHAGQEVLVLLAGAVEVALAGDGRQPAADRPRVTALTQPQQALVVPRGTWHQHRATRRGTALLYLTPCTDSATTPAPSQSQVMRQSEED